MSWWSGRIVQIFSTQAIEMNEPQMHKVDGAKIVTLSDDIHYN